AEEYFLSGDATTHRQASGSEWGRDGKWSAEPTGSVPYTTRVLVYRPADADRFNGTVVVSWNNVTAGYELFGGESDEFFEGGYAVALATVQRVGVDGFPTNSQGLAAWDPSRYGSLSIPTDDASYDIFTQVARAVGADRGQSGVDPLGGLSVDRVIGMGASQSAGRLATYVNAIHPLARAYDGFFLQIYFGSASALEVGDAIVNINAPSTTGTGSRVGLRGSNLIRDDLDVPVMVVNSELEAIACHDVRQPDTDRFRYWESAGTCHVSIQAMDVRAPKYEREFGTPQPVMQQMNRIAITPLYDAALHHLNRWVAGGPPPPTQPLIEFAGEPAEVVRDVHGIAVGGVRLPQAEVPVAQNSAIPLGDDIYSMLWGSSHPFDSTTLDSLYGSEETYLERFTDAARSAVSAGVLLDRDVAALVDEAQREYRRAARS
ncbi:MAG: alpha/beta hydrolase domain-containing protein, partial [Ilumatobacteraceae bacterium]